MEPQTNSGSHIKYFGFTIIDTHWDDPTDSETKRNYADEVHDFSNLADILVVSPTDNLTQRVQAFNNLDMKTVLHLNELFFELVGTNSPSGADYNLRTDYEERWHQFVTINQAVLDKNRIGTFYAGEEPTWNGISFAELSTVTALIKSQFPEIPVMIIEAYPILNDLQVPETADWIGFDHYFIKDPNSNPTFRQEWQTLKSKLSDSSQKIMVIMDSHYISWAHGDFGNIELGEMDDVANSYYQLAKNDTTVIGILGYFWPNGFDVEGSIGARGMPENIKNEYERIGKEITRKK